MSICFCYDSMLGTFSLSSVDEFLSEVLLGGELLSVYLGEFHHSQPNS